MTGENGNTTGMFTPAKSGTQSPSQGTFQGTGASSGLSTGLDASGYQSVVGFGFIDETSAKPIDYLAAFDPTSGLTDEDVLETLAALFNADFAEDRVIRFQHRHVVDQSTAGSGGFSLEFR